MSDGNIPSKWADLRPDEREAILEFAQLSPELRQRIYKAGRNIMWWEGFANRVSTFKWAILTAGAIAIWITDLPSTIASFFRN